MPIVSLGRDKKTRNQVTRSTVDDGDCNPPVAIRPVVGTHIEKNTPLAPAESRVLLNTPSELPLVGTTPPPQGGHEPPVGGGQDVPDHRVVAPSGWCQIWSVQDRSNVVRKISRFSPVASG